MFLGCGEDPGSSREEEEGGRGGRGGGEREKRDRGNGE